MDDEDKSVIFRGQWTRFVNDLQQYANLGPVYKGSQHRLLGESGGVTFKWRGKRFKLPVSFNAGRG